MERLLISPLNYIRNIDFLLFSFLKYRDCMFFVISIFVVVKECVVNSKCIFILFLVFVCHFFSVFIRAILERVCQSFNIYNASPLLFCSFESIYLSINLPTGNLPTNLSIRSYLSKFSKSSFISRNSTIYQNRLS